MCVTAARTLFTSFNRYAHHKYLAFLQIEKEKGKKCLLRHIIQSSFITFIHTQTNQKPMCLPRVFVDISCNGYISLDSFLNMISSHAILIHSIHKYIRVFVVELQFMYTYWWECAWVWLNVLICCYCSKSAFSRTKNFIDWDGCIHTCTYPTHRYSHHSPYNRTQKYSLDILKYM